MDDIIIRMATDDDLASIGSLWEKLVAYHNELDDRLPLAAEGGGEIYGQRLAEQLSDPEARVIVVELGSQLVGYAFGVVVDLVPDMFEHARSGLLVDIFVEQEYRGRGIGRKMTTSMAQWFSEQGLQYFEWHVAAGNSAGIDFWRSMGGDDLLVRMRLELDELLGDEK